MEILIYWKNWNLKEAHIFRPQELQAVFLPFFVFVLWLFHATKWTLLGNAAQSENRWQYTDAFKKKINIIKKLI